MADTIAKLSEYERAMEYPLSLSGLEAKLPKLVQALAAKGHMRPNIQLTISVNPHNYGCISGITVTDGGHILLSDHDTSASRLMDRLSLWCL